SASLTAFTAGQVREGKDVPVKLPQSARRATKYSTVATTTTTPSTLHSFGVTLANRNRIAAAARTGTTAPPGTRNPPGSAGVRRSFHAAAAQPRYTSATATLEMITSDSKPFVTARIHASVDCTMIAI